MALVQQLHDLYRLYKDGALTTDEFTQAKAATISSIPQAQINIEATSMALVEVEEPCSICLNPPADRDPGGSFHFHLSQYFHGASHTMVVTM